MLNALKSLLRRNNPDEIVQDSRPGSKCTSEKSFDRPPISRQTNFRNLKDDEVSVIQSQRHKNFLQRTQYNNDDNFLILRPDYAVYSEDTILDSSQKEKKREHMTFKKQNHYLPAGDILRSHRICALYKTMSGLRIAIKGKCKQDIVNGKCLCEHCGAVKLLMESQKGPISYQNTITKERDSFLRRSSSSIDKNSRQLQKVAKENTLKNDPCYLHLVSKLQSIEQRLNELEDRAYLHNPSDNKSLVITDRRNICTQVSGCHFKKIADEKRMLRWHNDTKYSGSAIGANSSKIDRARRQYGKNSVHTAEDNTQTPPINVIKKIPRRVITKCDISEPDERTNRNGECSSTKEHHNVIIDPVHVINTGFRRKTVLEKEIRPHIENDCFVDVEQFIYKNPNMDKEVLSLSRNASKAKFVCEAFSKYLNAKPKVKDVNEPVEITSRIPVRKNRGPKKFNRNTSLSPRNQYDLNKCSNGRNTTYYDSHAEIKKWFANSGFQVDKIDNDYGSTIKTNDEKTNLDLNSVSVQHSEKELVMSLNDFTTIFEDHKSKMQQKKSRSLLKSNKKIDLEETLQNIEHMNKKCYELFNDMS